MPNHTDDDRQNDNIMNISNDQPSPMEEPKPENQEPESGQESKEAKEPVTPESPDIFDDLAAIGRPLESLTASEKVLASLPMRKPGKDEWIRLHPDIHTPAYIYEDKSNQSWHLVMPGVVEPISELIRYVDLSLAANSSGDCFVWPVPIPSGQKAHPAHISAFAGAQEARNYWVRIAWGGHEYKVFRRAIAKNPPEWPAEISNASEMLRFSSKCRAFEVIETLDHPVVKRLLGQD